MNNGSDGLRRTSNVNGTIRTYMLDNGMMIRQPGSTGVSQATYLTGPRGPEYRRDDVNGSIKWYVFDGLGSVLAEMDPYGTLTASRKLDVYGAPRRARQAASTRSSATWDTPRSPTPAGWCTCARGGWIR